MRASGLLTASWASCRTCRSISYELGFVPRYLVTGHDFILELIVFGDYSSWQNVPAKVAELLESGKPDIIAYDRANDTILFAVEETAAVPTGNQSLQRCERMYGASMMKVPFWYLLVQYGVHLDQGTRQASVWPSLMAIALTTTFRTPSMVLFYSSLSSPEDYAEGEGVAQLFSILGGMLRNFVQRRQLLNGLEYELAGQFASMLNFVRETYANVTTFIPHEELLGTQGSAHLLADLASGRTVAQDTFPFLDWPLFSDLPAPVQQRQRPGGFLKADSFLHKLEAARGHKEAYTLSENAGSRPQPLQNLTEWVQQQQRIHARAPKLEPPVPFTVVLGEFPPSESGLRHVTTAKNILYLVDKTSTVIGALTSTFPRLAGKTFGSPSSPALVYVSNSVKPSRIWGDPYTGQFAAFAWIFGGTGSTRRTRFAYFPHQSHGVLNLIRGSRTKGARIFLSLADYLVFMAGAVYSVREHSWL